MMSDKSIFIISLDYELYWGVRNKRPIQSYKENLNGTAKAVEEILAVFRRYDIHATWAVVGFLFFQDEESLKKSFPGELPRYRNESLSPYPYINEARSLETRYHFAPDMIEAIRKQKNQEIATHTFSHYYCLEQIYNPEAFTADLSSAIKTAEAFGLRIKSIIFPRNQINEDIIPVLAEWGITSYRGNERGWAYNAAADNENNTFFRRGFRFLDAYLDLSGHHTYHINDVARKKPYNIVSSRFLRPFSPGRLSLEWLRLRRIKRAMTYAAKNKTIFHLWWHPHNFGRNTLENISFLKEILKHYETLKHQYKMQSLNMGELAHLIEIDS